MPFRNPPGPVDGLTCLPRRQPLRPLDQQTVVITGAAQGLGAALALAFAEKGSRLVLIDYQREGLERIAARCGNAATSLVADLSDAQGTDAAIASFQGRHTRVDTLIHNAAILDPKPFGSETLASFNRTVNVGLQAAFQLSRAVWPGMVAGGSGTLIFVSSRSGIEGFVNETAYCAAKHALEGFSKCLAMEGAPAGIASVTITPGMYMHTPMSERTYSADLRQKWVEPGQLAPAFLQLATDAMDFNGQRLDAWQLSQRGLSQ